MAKIKLDQRPLEPAKATLRDLTIFNRWRALPHIVGKFVDSGHPNHALVAIALVVFPFAGVAIVALSVFR